MPTSSPLVIAVDSSTTSSKAIIVDPEGNVLALGKEEIPLRSPQSGFAEHNPEHWWSSTNGAVTSAVSQLSDADKQRITAMGVTHQRETFAPFSEDGTPLRDGILWMDIRAADQIAKYGSKDIWALSGKPPDVTPGIYKMAWVKENQPGLLEKADRVTNVHAFLVFKLLGEWKDSVATADSLGLFDIAKQQYDPKLLEIAGIREDQTVELHKPGEVIGTIKKDVVEGWGLSQEITLVAGLGDGQAAGIGAASVDQQTLYMNLGTAVVAGVLAEDYAFGPAYRTLAAGIPDHYVLEVLQNSGAFLPTWYRTAFGDPKLGGRPDPELERIAAERAPGAGGLVTMPYWNAVQSPYWDPIARGAVVGWRGSHGRGSMYRSILEAIGLEMARSLAGMEEATGTKVTTVRAMGGGVRSPLWRQIMADTSGLPITACLEDEISALGAGVLAMASTGVHGDTSIRTAANEMARFGDVVEPNEELHEVYQELGEIQGELYSALKSSTDKLQAFARKHPDVEVGDVE
jgi:xylulokinase